MSGIDDMRVAFKGDHDAAIVLAVDDDQLVLSVGWVDGDAPANEVKLSDRDIGWLVDLLNKVRREMHGAGDTP